MRPRRWRQSAEKSPPPAPARRVVKVAVFLVLMIDSLTSGLFIPLSLLYLVARSGASLAHVGILLTLAGIVALPLPLWIGRLVDRLGARSMVMVAQALQAAGFVGYVLVSNLPAVFVAATIASLGRAVFWSSVYTLVSGLSEEDPDPRARERWFAATGSLRAAGYGIGVLVAGVALSVNSVRLYQSVIAANTVLLIIAAALLATFVPNKTAPALSDFDQSRGYRTLWADRPYLRLIALNTMFALCNVLLGIGYAPFIAHSLPGITWVVGPLLAMNTAVQAVVQPLMVRLLRGLGRHVSLCLAGGLWASWSLATMLALYVPKNGRVPCLVLAVLCYSAAQMIHSPVSNAMSADAAPIDIRGRYLATFQSSFAIATVVAPTMFSVLLGVGNAVPWAVLSVAAMLTIPAMLLLAPRLPHEALTGVHAQPVATSS